MLALVSLGKSKTMPTMLLFGLFFSVKNEAREFKNDKRQKGGKGARIVTTDENRTYSDAFVYTY